MVNPEIFPSCTIPTYPECAIKIMCDPDCDNPNFWIMCPSEWDPEKECAVDDSSRQIRFNIKHADAIIKAIQMMKDTVQNLNQ